jgi:heterodisulfide reductase subunit B2
MTTTINPKTYSYFPGCSLERNAQSYQMSTQAIAKPLGLDLLEIDDWNCCGATEYISLNLLASYALVARNLAQATKNVGVDQVVAPCSACYLNLRKCDHYMHEDADLERKVNQALSAGGLSYKGGTLRVRHLLDVVVNDVGFDAIAEKVTRPLKGLRIAPYYGCMIVRPTYKSNGSGQPAFDNTEYPTSLDKLLKRLGAEVVDFPMKAHCCGGHMTQISESTGFELIRRLVKGATDYQSDMIVTLCPMCQLNLDGFQAAMNSHFKTDYHMPVLYFTQALGLAMGIPADQLGIGQELVDARPALAKIGVEVPVEPEPVQKKRPPKGELPMPRMPEEN